MIGHSTSSKRSMPIYWLAYVAIRPTDPILEPHLRHLIWAYDEYQSINTQKFPTGQEIFGFDPQYRNIVAGSYPGGISKSIIMKRCYRTPGPVLLAAHALGMGLYFKGGNDCWPYHGGRVAGTGL
jgi:superfamily I DNA and RNA helicase